MDYIIAGRRAKAVLEQARVETSEPLLGLLTVAIQEAYDDGYVSAEDAHQYDAIEAAERS